MDRESLQTTQAVDERKGNGPVFYGIPMLLKRHGWVFLLGILVLRIQVV